jgi:hypothetical protein
MVSGKPSNRSARGVDIPPTTRNLVFHTRTDVREYVPQRMRVRPTVTHTVGVRFAPRIGVRSCSRATDVILHIGCAYGPTFACGGIDPRVGMKGKRLLRNNRWMFQACELGLPLQGLKFDSESSVSRGD